MEGFQSSFTDGVRQEVSRPIDRSMDENEWEVLSTPGSILAGDEEEEDKCCSVSLWIDPGSLIKANYFSLSRCNSGNFKTVEEEGGSPQYVVDDGFRVRNSSLVLDMFTPSFCKDDEMFAPPFFKDDEMKGNRVVAAGHIKSDDMTEGMLCISPVTMFRSPDAFGKGESDEKYSDAEDEENEEYSGQSDELEVEEDHGSKPVEVEEVEEGGLARLENSQPKTCRITVGNKTKAAGWKHPLGVWKRQVNTLCSLGMAAALMGILVLGRRWCNWKNKNHGQSQRLRFQVFADNQRISQMMCQAARLNQAFSAMRGGGGVPVVRAQISFGGGCYYDGI